MKPKIILDTDPGGDDVMAIIWLAALHKAGLCEILALTSSEGNANSKQTYLTTQRILTLLGLENVVRVGRGVETGKESDGFNGADGLGGNSYLLPEAPSNLPTWEKATWSDDMIIEILEKEPEHSVTIVAVAPLTNLAAAETKKKGTLRKARQVALMGGAFDAQGNVTPVAEFNIWFNPSALRVVLESRYDVLILPVDVTTQITFGKDDLEMVARFLKQGDARHARTNTSSNSFFRRSGLASPKRGSGRASRSTSRSLSRSPSPPSSPTGGEPLNLAPSALKIWQFVSAVAEKQIRQSLRFKQSNGDEKMVLHDSAAVAAIFYPELFRYQQGHVFVEEDGTFTSGKTLIDARMSAGARPEANAFVAMEVQGKLVTSTFVEELTGFFDSFWDDAEKDIKIMKL